MEYYFPSKGFELATLEVIDTENPTTIRSIPQQPHKFSFHFCGNVLMSSKKHLNYFNEQKHILYQQKIGFVKYDYGLECLTLLSPIFQ